MNTMLKTHQIQFGSKLTHQQVTVFLKQSIAIDVFLHRLNFSFTPQDDFISPIDEVILKNHLFVRDYFPGLTEDQFLELYYIGTVHRIANKELSSESAFENLMVQLLAQSPEPVVKTISKPGGICFGKHLSKDEVEAFLTVCIRIESFLNGLNSLLDSASIASLESPIHLISDYCHHGDEDFRINYYYDVLDFVDDGTITPEEAAVKVLEIWEAVNQKINI